MKKVAATAAVVGKLLTVVSISIQINSRQSGKKGKRMVAIVIKVRRIGKLKRVCVCVSVRCLQAATKLIIIIISITVTSAVGTAATNL